jgi:hypothetical protein
MVLLCVYLQLSQHSFYLYLFWFVVVDFNDHLVMHLLHVSLKFTFYIIYFYQYPGKHCISRVSIFIITFTICQLSLAQSKYPYHLFLLHYKMVSLAKKCVIFSSWGSNFVYINTRTLSIRLTLHISVSRSISFKKI